MSKHSNKTPEQASNRVEVLLYTLKYNFLSLFTAGITVFIFCIPLIVLYAVSSFMIFDLAETEKTVEAIFNIYNTCNLIAIPLLIIASVGFAGTGKIIKNLSWEASCLFLQDFRAGLKDNFLQYAITFTVIGFFNFVGGLNYYVLNTPAETYLTVLSAVCVFFLLLILPAAVFTINQINVYKQNYFKILKLSFILYVSTLFKTLFMFVMTLMPYLLLLIPNPTAKFILLSFLLIFYAPIQLQIWFLYSCHIFDKKINPVNFPDIIDKGITGTK